MTLVLVLAVLLPWSLSRQIREHRITRPRLIRLPLIFAAVGLLGLSTADLPTDAIAAAYVAVSLAVSVLLGVWRGAVIPVWKTPAGEWRSKGNRLTIALWVVLIFTKFLMASVASSEGWFPATATGEVFLFLAVSIGAQNLVVARRTIAGHIGASASRRRRVWAGRPHPRARS